MNTLLKTILGLSALCSLLAAPALALADATTSAPLPAKTAAMTRMTARADQEVDRRTTNLNDLVAKIADIQNLSAADKTSITTAVTNQINGLAQLKAKIDADTDAATLKADVQSVVDAYRVYALVMPQVRIIVAADRVVTVASEMQLFSAKLGSRISAAQSAGADMTAAANSFADFNAKVSAASTGAQDAVNGIATLVPDGGDKTKMAANTAALKNARAKIVSAQQDLAAARKDALAIIDAVKGKPTTPVANTATTTASATTTGQ